MSSVPDWTALPRPPGYAVQGRSDSGEFEKIEAVKAHAWEDGQNNGENIHRKSPNEPTLIRIKFHGKVPRKELQEILTPELKIILSASGRVPEGQKAGIPTWKAASEEEEIEIMTVESFNHKGMTGSLFDDGAAPIGKSHWMMNTQALGVTSDDESRRGSKGKGKIAIEGASRMAMRMIYTVRDGDEEYPRAMIGAMRTSNHQRQVVVSPHGETKVVEMTPSTYFCEGLDDEKGIIPITDPGTLDRFVASLKFTRKPGESGVSHAILQPKDGIVPDAYARAVFSRYLLQIMRGHLAFEIISEDGSLLEIRRDNLSEIVEKMDWGAENDKVVKEANFAKRNADSWKKVIAAYQLLMEVE